jgi:hypothetical protein
MPLGGQKAGDGRGAQSRLDLFPYPGRSVQLRHAPRISFALDTSFSYAEKIDGLLHAPEVQRDLRDADPEPIPRRFRVRTDLMRRRKGLPIHGWINLDKPVGPTSTQAIGRVRRITGAARVGHAGTLDPLASGVLPIALGEATKTVPYIQDAGRSIASPCAGARRPRPTTAEGA